MLYIHYVYICIYTYDLIILPKQQECHPGFACSVTNNIQHVFLVSGTEQKPSHARSPDGTSACFPGSDSLRSVSIISIFEFSI